MNNKRSLRNSNTCPSVPNPLRQPYTPASASPLPANLTSLLQHLPNLTCQNINSLPVLPQPQFPQAQLQKMQKAFQQQSQEVGEMYQGICEMEEVKKGKDGEMQMEDVKEEECGLPMLASQLFDNDLRSFLREGPQPIIDCQYEFNVGSFIHFQNPSEDAHLYSRQLDHF